VYYGNPISAIHNCFCVGGFVSDNKDRYSNVAKLIMKKCKQCGDNYSPINRKKSIRKVLDDVQEEGFCTIRCAEAYYRKRKSK
jgi:hypothetical protein